MMRVNLFCGTGLAAALTPLYRSSSPLVAFGGATDTNNNFVSGDFSESSGLKGDGSTKHLTTGFNPSNLIAPFNCHLSYSGTSLETSGDRIAMGTFAGGVTNTLFIADSYASYVSGRCVRIGSGNAGRFTVATSPGTSESHILGTRTSATALLLYRSGTQFGAINTSNAFSDGLSLANVNIPIFALSNNGTIANLTAANLRMYSIGHGVNATQVAAFSSAVAAFNTALGR
jgi:hypothetical protein